MREDTITTKVYKFDELSESAKENARDWFRQCSYSDEWWINCYEDIQQQCEDIGITLNRKNPMYFDIDRGWHLDLQIDSTDWIKLLNWMFEGMKVKANHFDLIANHASWKKSYCRHPNTRIEIESPMYDGAASHPRLHKKLTELALHCESVWDSKREDLLGTLRDESKYQSSDEYIDDVLINNDYEFEENGKHY